MPKKGRPHDAEATGLDGPSISLLTSSFSKRCWMTRTECRSASTPSTPGFSPADVRRTSARLPHVAGGSGHTDRSFVESFLVSAAFQHQRASPWTSDTDESRVALLWIPFPFAEFSRAFHTLTLVRTGRIIRSDIIRRSTFNSDIITWDSIIRRMPHAPRTGSIVAVVRYAVSFGCCHYTAYTRYRLRLRHAFRRTFATRLLPRITV